MSKVVPEFEKQQLLAATSMDHRTDFVWPLLHMTLSAAT